MILPRNAENFVEIVPWILLYPSGRLYFNF